MKRISNLIIGGMLGLLLGAGGVGMYYRQALQKTMEQAMIQAYRSDVLDCVNTLTALRRGGAERVIIAKEEEMSIAVHALHLAFDTNIFSNRDTLRAMQMAAQYRAAHPYTLGIAEIDAVVDEFFAGVPK